MGKKYAISISVGVIGATIITAASNVYVAVGVYTCLLAVEIMRK